MTLYDRIGTTYASYRRPDPRIAAAIDEAIGDGSRVVSVGSGTGSYEPTTSGSVAVEPSLTMISQRPPGSIPVVRAVAERLPFAEDAFDVSLAVLTIHHWTDPATGFRELARSAPRQVILTWEPQAFASFWLVSDYIPEIPRNEIGVASLRAVLLALRVTDVRPVPVPWDCTDGFCGAYWRRPEMYLDAGARAAISGFARCDPSVVGRAIARLRADLADGSWLRRNAGLLELTELDLGYRLVVAEGSR